MYAYIYICTYKCSYIHIYAYVFAYRAEGGEGGRERLAEVSRERRDGKKCTWGSGRERREREVAGKTTQDYP